MRWLSALSIAAIALPESAWAQSAQTVSTIAGAFNIITGLMLATSFLLFVGGLLMWVTRLGTYPTYRDQAITVMQWAVGILFVLVVLLALVQFVQNHISTALIILGAIIVALIAWAVFFVASTSAESEDAH